MFFNPAFSKVSFKRLGLLEIGSSLVIKSWKPRYHGWPRARLSATTGRTMLSDQKCSGDGCKPSVIAAFFFVTFVFFACDLSLGITVVMTRGANCLTACSKMRSVFSSPLAIWTASTLDFCWLAQAVERKSMAVQAGILETAISFDALSLSWH